MIEATGGGHRAAYRAVAGPLAALLGVVAVTILGAAPAAGARPAGAAGTVAEPVVTPAPTATAGQPTVTDGPCRFTQTPDEPAARPVSLPPDPEDKPAAGTVEVVLNTNHGDIPLEVEWAKAPCTVLSFLHLATHGFYDATVCHRLTAYETLKVLQCGDPSGTGSGGPGYSFRDELPTDLPPAPTDPTGERDVYARGVLAMANAGPDTNGSQFFLVYADSALRPNYSIFGTVTAEGLATLDRIAAGGVVPTESDPDGVDGAPAMPTEIVTTETTAKPHC